jgi:hypothetical protein
MNMKGNFPLLLRNSNIFGRKFIGFIFLISNPDFDLPGSFNFIMADSSLSWPASMEKYRGALLWLLIEKSIKNRRNIVKAAPPLN